MGRLTSLPSAVITDDSALGGSVIQRSLRLNDNDKIRQHATQQIRSYFKIDYKNFKDQFGINVRDYFKKEIEYMSEMEKDGLIKFSKEGIFLTDIGRDFTQNIMNVFDSYDPPQKSYKERLETVKKAKESQAAVQEKFDTIIN